MPENKPVIVALVVVGLLLLALLGYVALTSEPETTVSEPVTLPAPVAAVPHPESERPPLPDPNLSAVPLPEPEPEPVDTTPPEPAFVLPRLDSSDELFRDGVASLTKSAEISDWLEVGELARRFVVTADNVSRGLLPRDQLGVLAPDQPFAATRISDEDYLLDEAGYRRFDMVAEVAGSIDARRAAEFYDLVRPLLQEGHEELGYQGGNFDEVVLGAIGRLLETPIVPGPIRLKRPVVMYEFADPSLERLSDAQKQLVRMGPNNTRAIQASLRAFALELRAMRRQ